MFLPIIYQACAAISGWFASTISAFDHISPFEGGRFRDPNRTRHNFGGPPHPTAVVSQDVVSFNSAMAVSDWAAALGLLAKMPSCGVSPDLISYSSAISAAEKGEQRARLN